MGSACSSNSTAVTPHDAPVTPSVGGVEYTDETRRARSKELFLRNQRTPVKRVEIRQLSGPMQARFIAALRRMMVGERDSVYCKISAIHGGSELTNPPTPLYCRHKFESFPTWHRAYLTEFELALQVADSENGGDGVLCLPYWDWLNVTPGNTLPHFLCDVFPSACTVEFNRLSEEDVLASLKTSNLAERVDRALWGTEHSRVASTRGGPWSIEDPHNRVHVAIGGAMADVPTAAFDPMFWLHHANVDRIYESYLRYDADAEAEFRANAQRESEKPKPLSPIAGGGNEYTSALAPFVRSDDGKDWLNAQCFSTAKCGYVYDALVDRRPQQLRESPVDVVFPGVEQAKMDGRGVDIVVFLHRKGTPPPNPTREGGMRVWAADPSFGGTAAIFGRTGSECATCRVAEPYDLVVDVTAAVRRMGVDRNDVAVVAFASRPVHPRVLDAVPAALPAPVVRYPIFASRSPTDLGPGATGDVVVGLQKWLARFGRIATEEVDGALTGATDGAVRAIQHLIAKGITPDGVVGPLTRKLLTQPRCAVPDGGDRASAQARVAASHCRSHHAGGKNAMKYAVGVPPGYLATTAVLADIDAAFAAWAGPAGIKFERVAELGASDVVSVRWHSKPQAAERELLHDAAADAWLQEEDHVAVFDGEGGTLARATHRGILFDMAERWYTGTGPAPAGYAHAVSLRAVCAHEIGHVLGLTHSDSLDDIMAPFYQPMFQPQAADIARLKALLA